MSFVRLPPKGVKGSAATSKIGEKKKKKPDWDSTYNDLSVYKASPEEIVRRKQVHQSKNVETVQLEKLRKKIARARIQGKSPGSAKKRQQLHKQRQNALLREMLFDQSQLHDTLVKSDKAMSVVKDLFGDDPKKFRGLPNVTTAPNEKNAKRPLPDGSTIEQPTGLDLLSDSVMNKNALNDLGSDSDYEDEEDEEEAESYKPVIDFERFQRFLELTEQGVEDEQRTGKLRERVAAAMANERLEETAPVKQLPTQGVRKPSSNMNGSYLEEGGTPHNSPKFVAMNDTGKVERAMSRLEHVDQNTNTKPATSVAAQPASVADLKQVLEGLEANIADYERMTGRQPSLTAEAPSSFSGYTLSLVNAVSKLTAYLKESERRLHAETTLREQLGQDVQQMKAAFDALTADVISTQEEYIQLFTEFTRTKKDTQQQLQLITHTLVSHNIRVPPLLGTGHVTAEVISKVDTQPVSNSLLSSQHHSNAPIYQSQIPVSKSQPQASHSQPLPPQMHYQQQQQQQMMEQRQHQQMNLQEQQQRTDLRQQQIDMRKYPPIDMHQQQQYLFQQQQKLLLQHSASEPEQVSTSINGMDVRPAVMLSPPAQMDSPKPTGPRSRMEPSRWEPQAFQIAALPTGQRNDNPTANLSTNPPSVHPQNLPHHGRTSAFRPPQAMKSPVPLPSDQINGDDRLAIQLQFERMEQQKREVEKKLQQLQMMQEEAKLQEAQLRSSVQVRSDVSPSISPIPDSSDVGAPRQGIPPAPGPPVLSWSKPPGALVAQTRFHNRGGQPREITVAMPRMHPLQDATPPGAPPHTVFAKKSPDANRDMPIETVTAGH